MSGRFLESILLGACPGLRESWDVHRRTFEGGSTTDDHELLDAVRRHVLGLLAEGRVAEFSRVRVAAVSAMRRSWRARRRARPTRLRALTHALLLDSMSSAHAATRGRARFRPR